MKTLPARWKYWALAIAAGTCLTPATAKYFLDLTAAARPIEDGIPEVAVSRLRSLLAQPLPDAEKRVIECKLAEALVLSGQPEEALTVLESPALRADSSAAFWKAQALAASQRWAEALPIYQALSADHASPMRFDALFGAAESLRALGHGLEALPLLAQLQAEPKWKVRAQLRSAETLLDRRDVTAAAKLLPAISPQSLPERNEKHFLFGRLRLEEKQMPKAIENFAAIIKNPEGVSHELLIATLFAMADAHLEAQTPRDGDDFLEDFIDRHPVDAALPEVFAKLDALYRAERKPSRNELSRWARDEVQPRRALALWYLARMEAREGRRDLALERLTELRESGAKFPVLAVPMIELAQMQLAGRAPDDALATLENARGQNPTRAVRDQIEWLAAQAHAQSGHFAAAAPAFEAVARRAPAQARDALYNAAVCWLRADRADQFASDYQQISDPGAKGDLLLEQGFTEAARNDLKARQIFDAFLHENPQSPRLAEAWVALAEIAFHASPPDLALAKNDLQRAAQSRSNAAATERAEYLAIWIAEVEKPSEQAAVIALARHFTEQHPQSPLLTEARMKLAEAYYRAQDFANAQTQFELIARANPQGPLAEQALFFGAKSAMSVMGAQSADRALALLDQAVKLDGDLKWAARNEEASIERKVGKPADASLLYDEVLKGDARAPEKREALCGKADVSYELAANDPAKYRSAIELFDQLAAEPGVPAHWRNQALFKKGKCLEKLSDPAGALATYYHVIEETARPDLPQEFFWFFKAGFDAARLLETDQKWEPALVIYRKLAAAGGARSDEAKARLTQLRLEHFVWDE